MIDFPKSEEVLADIEKTLRTKFEEADAYFICLAIKDYGMHVFFERSGARQ